MRLRLLLGLCLLSAVQQLESEQLGDGTSIHRKSFVRVGADVVYVSASAYTTLFIRKDRSLWGSGVNDEDILAVGAATPVATPVLLAKDVVDCAAGALTVYFVTSDHVLWRLARRADSTDLRDAGAGRPNAVKVMTRVNRVVQGADSVVVVLTDGTLARLSSDGKTSRLLGSVTTVAARTAILALRTDGSVWGIGRSTNGQLGTLAESTTETVRSMMPGGAVQVSNGAGYSMILTKNGELFGTGMNSWGNLGLGDRKIRTKLTLVATDVAEVSCGDQHTLILKKNGDLFATGGRPDEFGVNGDGTTDTLLTPKRVLTGVARVFAGAYTSFALKSDGTLWATGANTNFGMF